MLSTWSFGRVANEAGMKVLRAGGAALDAVVAGASAVEIDPTVDSVGLGGLPDASGEVSLDACVMTNPDRCGSVSYIRGFVHPAAIARAVMEKTLYAMLAGEGAEAFARRHGFEERPRGELTPTARAVYEAWKASPDSKTKPGQREGYVTPMNVEERYLGAGGAGGAGSPLSPSRNHDTVTMLCRDARGALAGACSTSGLAFKVPGRVGDSPIIGHGLYVDQQVGGAGGTGTGELIMGTCGSFLVVEFMRQGRSPAEAINEVLKRIASRFTLLSDNQAAFIAMRSDGAWATGSLRPGFAHCHSDAGGHHSADAQFVALR